MPKNPTSSRINDIHTPEAMEQRRIRIRLTMAAVAYEFYSESIMSDGDFDALSKRVNPDIETGHPTIDWFFSEHFQPDTGMWIHDHPELDKCKRHYEYMRRIGAYAEKDPENPYGI